MSQMTVNSDLPGSGGVLVVGQQQSPPQPTQPQQPQQTSVHLLPSQTPPHTDGVTQIHTTNSTGVGTPPASTGTPVSCSLSPSEQSSLNGSGSSLYHHPTNNSHHNLSTTSSSSASTTYSSSSPPSMASTAEYLQQLLKDRSRLSVLPATTFNHAERLFDAEITRVRAALFQSNDGEHSPLVLPEPEGEIVTKTEKVYVPVDDHPEFNFVGRILGPRGMTAKQLEADTGCKIMVRGRGSMRDKKKEEMNRGKPNWEHLDDKLHVLITVSDTENRARIKLDRAIDEVTGLLVPITEGEDELKKRQLMELAIMNGTYRDTNSSRAAAQAQAQAAAAAAQAAAAANGVIVSQVMAPQMTAFDEHQHMKMLAASGLFNPYRSLATASPTTAAAAAAAAQAGAPLILAPNGRQFQSLPGAGFIPVSGPGNPSQHHLQHLNSHHLAAQQAQASQPPPPLIDSSALLYSTHPQSHPHHLSAYDFHAVHAAQQYAATFAACSAAAANNAALSAAHSISAQQSHSGPGMTNASVGLDYHTSVAQLDASASDKRVLHSHRSVNSGSGTTIASSVRYHPYSS